MYSKKHEVQGSTKRITAIILVAALVVSLVFAAGCGGDKGIVGKWAVSGEGSDMFVEGMIIEFTKGGEIKFSASDNASEEAQFALGLMQIAKMTYKVKGDQLEMTVEALGQKETNSTKFKVDGDKLTFYDEDGAESVLTRAK